MASVTKIVATVKQPKGGYIKPSDFEVEQFNDGIDLYAEESLHGTIVGLAVDYLTRFSLGIDKTEAFRISLNGAKIAEKINEMSAEKYNRKRKKKNLIEIANDLLDDIKGLDDTSIIHACQLVTFDVWKRNLMGAARARNYQEVYVDDMTISNIRVMVQRSLSFFDRFGFPENSGFTFEPDEISSDTNMMDELLSKGSFGGYTLTVSSGDGDFLTKDTMWDFKVSKNKLTSNLMIWKI